MWRLVVRAVAIVLLLLGLISALGAKTSGRGGGDPAAIDVFIGFVVGFGLIAGSYWLWSLTDKDRT